MESFLVRRQTGQHCDLEFADLEHEDIAMAAMLDKMGCWCRGEGSPPYPLAAAAQDHLIGLAIGLSVELGRPVTTRREIWAAD